MFRNRRQRPEYDDDFFQDTRMSFGDHLEELRSRMWKAIKGLGLCLIIGFILDGIGDALDRPGIGVGKPMLKVITDPVESQVREFYHKRNDKASARLAEARAKTEENRILNQQDMRVSIPTKAFTDTFDGITLKNPEQTHIDVTIKVSPAEVNVLADQGNYDLEKSQFLTSLSVTEAFMVYFKVSLLCGVVLSCPWLFWQFWAFVGAGLYPHEKKLVHVYMPFSIFLFLAGVLLCQFVVLPRAVAALLGFNSYIGIDPDFRLNEWLGFAIVMPLVFGISFQTPLVMMFLNRIGVVTWDVFLAKWRYAVFVLAISSALLTPSTDIVSMLWLFIPMLGLYMLGILICYLTPPREGAYDPLEEEEVGV